MNCLWCDQELIPEVSWKSLFLWEKQARLCQRCFATFHLLEGERCNRCSRPETVTVCSDCQWWERWHGLSDALTYNISIFSYNEQMRDIIYQWKYRGDYCLGSAFQSIFVEMFVRHFPMFRKSIIVPIPLTEERYVRRGFNQADVLARFLPGQTYEVLRRLGGEKQAKKTRLERLSTNNPFKLLTTVNKPVILVDDIYTTGMTIRHAAQLLKKSGCPHVTSYTLVRG